MSLDAEPIAIVLRVASELDRLGIEYLVGGSIASSVHGRARTTQDIDIVAAIPGRQVEAFVNALKSDFYVDADMVREAIQRRSSFNVVHLETLMKVDVFVFSGDDLTTEEMRRRVSVTLRGSPIWFASAEDIVLQKLEWYRKGQGISERQWRDVLGVLEVQGPRFDVIYARAWAARLGLSELFERALTEVPTT